MCAFEYVFQKMHASPSCPGGCSHMFSTCIWCLVFFIPTSLMMALRHICFKSKPKCSSAQTVADFLWCHISSGLLLNFSGELTLTLIRVLKTNL
jgi:hypothetical protein